MSEPKYKIVDESAEAPAIVRVDEKPPTGTDSERTAVARAKQIERSKRYSRTATFGRIPESGYQNFAGPETSYWDFEHVCYLLYKLADIVAPDSFRFNAVGRPTYAGLWCNRDDGKYDRATATWTCDEQKAKFLGTNTTVSLAELNAALAMRIAELGISRMMLEEYLATPHKAEDEQAFDKMPFAERVNQFKVSQ